ncbi:MAG: FCD domain-containing protein [Boseongicola sp.]|nr:MAG: FCD domain-containing protein [Boseongicola sp.]
MPSSSEHVLAVVRGQILRGERAPGDKINEVGIASDLEVSRTPARTALAALEAEGLIERRQGRGFTIRSISAADVAKAIDVRSALEGLAAQTMAKSGMSDEAEQKLLDSIAISQAVLDSDDPDTDFIGGYTEANKIYHQTIMHDCGNDLIAHTFERIAMLPLTALGTLAFDKTNYKRERMRLTVGHSQHVIIFDALKKREGQRAEALMREHSNATLNYTDLFVKKVYDQGRGRRQH